MKKILFFIIIFICSAATFAQETEAPKFQQSKHEITLWGGYGLSTLKYDLSFGERTDGFGYLAGLGYNYYFNYNWSLGLGAEFSVLTANSKFKNLTDNYNIPGFLGVEKPLNLEIHSSNYKQSYTAYYLNIPVMAKYQLDVWKRNKFYVAGGAKVGFPIMKSEYSSKGNFMAKGFERDQQGGNIGSAYTMEKYGFGERKANLSDGETELDMNVMLSVETGMKWRLSDNVSLYTGVYFDYGLLDIRKGKDDLDLFQYNTNSQTSLFSSYTYNNALNAVYTKNANGKREALTDKVNTMSVGLKVQLGFNLGSKIDRKVKKSILVEKEKGLTAQEVDHIVSRNAKDIIDAQHNEFNDIKAILNRFFEKEKKEVEKGYRLQTIFGFELDKTALLPEMISVLNENLKVMQENPSLNVKLTGNTDDIGSSPYNYDLGRKRSNVVKDWLVSKGIDESRLVIASEGDKNPAIPNIDEANRKYNRRVEFIVIK